PSGCGTIGHHRSKRLVGVYGVPLPSLAEGAIPMRGQSYRIIVSTIGILSVGNRRSLTVPTGATVTVSDGPIDVDGNQLVDVSWEGTELMMFTHDLRDRAQLIPDRDAE